MKHSDLPSELRAKIKKLVRADKEWAKYIDRMIADPTVSGDEIRTVVECVLVDYP